MKRRLATLVCVIALGLGVAGCSKCGWFWQDGYRSCHSEPAPR